MIKPSAPDPESLTIGDLLKPDPRNRYLIPRYQRNYAWGEAEISQLIRDVEDCRQQRNQSPYYIGTLVVHRRPDAKGGEYETIDGQQRLTTLSILIAYLRHLKVDGTSQFTEPVLRFQSRAVSERVIRMLFTSSDPATDCDPGSSLTAGFRLVERALNAAREEAESPESEAGWLEKFTRYLCHNVIIFRVQVPPDTDLNHYFEVMNSRGEQLEKHEVLKATLMGALDREEGRTFGKIWEACSNMEKYVQMNFSPNTRGLLFGCDWDSFLPADFNEAHGILAREGTPEAGTHQDSLNLDEILAQPLVKSEATRNKDSEIPPDQFRPVINFPNFLLHVLNVHIGDHDALQDDKNLIKVFADKMPKSNAEAAKAFAYGILRARFLLDQYVLKRDFRSGNDDWSLLRMKRSTASSYYSNTFDGGEIENKRVLMLQAALHVSNPSVTSKYWLLGTLRYLMAQPHGSQIAEGEFLRHLESMASRFVFDVYLDTRTTVRLADVTANTGFDGATPRPLSCRSELLRYRGIRNNLVFNFLDYLLWIGGPKRRFSASGINSDDFKFTFRSSVEHHAPQNPESGVNEFGDEVHAFGNLYLISHSKNSRLSNFMAESKRGEFLRAGTADSLKQQFMLDHKGDWDLDAMRSHERQMLRVLEAATKYEPPFDPCLFEEILGVPTA